MSVHGQEAVIAAVLAAACLVLVVVGILAAH